MICSSRLREREAPSLANGPSFGQRGLASGCFCKPGARATNEKGLPDERVYNLCGHGCTCKVDHVQGARRHDRREVRQDVRRLPVRRGPIRLAEGPAAAAALRLDLLRQMRSRPQRSAAPALCEASCMDATRPGTREPMCCLPGNTRLMRCKSRNIEVCHALDSHTKIAIVGNALRRRIS